MGNTEGLEHSALVMKIPGWVLIVGLPGWKKSWGRWFLLSEWARTPERRRYDTRKAQ
jgi:hypothetical protein